MTRGDVPDLVTQDADQLRLALEIRQDAPGDIDEPTGHGEGVDDRLVDDREMPGEPWTLGCLGQALAEVVDVAL